MKKIVFISYTIIDTNIHGSQFIDININQISVENLDLVANEYKKNVIGILKEKGYNINIEKILITNFNFIN